MTWRASLTRPWVEGWHNVRLLICHVTSADACRFFMRQAGEGVT